MTKANTPTNVAVPVIFSQPAKSDDLLQFDGKETLLWILELGRPHGGHNEGLLGEWLRDAYGAQSLLEPITNEPLALYVDIPHPNGDKSTTLFSAHLDTVDRGDCYHNLIEDERGNLFTDGKTILGADDGAGVWLMTRMIEQNIPGVYVFPRGEECGGIGSKGMAEHYAHWLKSFDRAVAFDRADTFSVITHQGFGRCCSDVFAKALGDELSLACQDEYMFVEDDTGVYTDTAEWTHIIPECTNLSIGYAKQHSTNERLDLHFLVTMAEIVGKINWDGLPVDRDPFAPDPDDERWPKWHGFNTWPTYDKKDDSRLASQYDYNPPKLTDLAGLSPRELSDLMMEYPDEMADLLYDLIN